MKTIKKKEFMKSSLKISKLKANNPIIDHFKSHYWAGAEFIGKYEFIKLSPINIRRLPNENNVISFSEIFSSKYKKNLNKYWVDMFNDDVVIERFWNNPEKYLPLLKNAIGVIASDYSVMKGLLLTDNINNVQRNRITAFLLERENITTIPVASWYDKDSFEWCFDGLPHKSIIAVSSNGCLKGNCKTSKSDFIKGVFKLNELKKPSKILICGPRLKELDSLKNIVYYKSFQQRLYERINKNGK